MIRALAVLLALLPGVALADGAVADGDRPPPSPTRDVDVTYRIGGANGPATLQQRMRWDAADRRQRLDAPTPGLYMLLDCRARQMSVVSDPDRKVLDVGAGNRCPGDAAAAGPFSRRGAEQVAGVACTDWETVDSTGHPTLACITADGVLLRAQAGDRTLVEAVSVSFAPQDPRTFLPPLDYQHIQPPPVPPQAAPGPGVPNPGTPAPARP